MLQFDLQVQLYQLRVLVRAILVHCLQKVDRSDLTINTAQNIVEAAAC